MASGFPWQTEFALADLYRLPAIAEPDRRARFSAGAAPRSNPTPMTRVIFRRLAYGNGPVCLIHTNAATTRLISST